MTTELLLIKINENFDRIQTALLDQFGDEGHDIGDALDATELLGNTEEPHDSYEIRDFLTVISDYLKLDINEVEKTYHKFMEEPYS
jgi:hypothetical protein